MLLGLCSEESYPIKVSYRNAVTWGWNRGTGGNKNPNACVSQGKLTGKWRSVTQAKGSIHLRNLLLVRTLTWVPNLVHFFMSFLQIEDNSAMGIGIFGTLVCVVLSWIMNNLKIHLRFCKSHKMQQFVCSFSVFFVNLCWPMLLTRKLKTVP